jgi:hypothetical protein
MDLLPGGGVVREEKTEPEEGDCLYWPLQSFISWFVLSNDLS